MDYIKINNKKENIVEVGNCSENGNLNKEIIGIFFYTDSAYQNRIVKAYKVDVIKMKIIEIDKSNIDVYDGEIEVRGDN